MLIDPATNFSASTFQHLGRRLRCRANRRLQQLPDFLLRDIGLGRDEIAAVIRGKCLR